jgi:hypothetical protein
MLPRLRRRLISLLEIPWFKSRMAPRFRRNPLSITQRQWFTSRTMPQFRRRFIAIVQSPWFISLVAVAVVLPFLPMKPEPYTLEVVSTQPVYQGIHYWYDDLDNDGTPEQITLLDKENGAGVMVRNSHNYIEQWNVAGDYSFLNNHNLFITGDYDADGTKEIYLFSLAGDSILLHSIPDFREPVFGVHNRLIARAGPGNKRPDPEMIPACMRDLDGDGQKELIFGISSGFSLYPRNVYAYFPGRDSLIISPPSCIPFHALLQADTDSDGIGEIILHNTAPSNCDPSLHPYHDHSSWQVILDNQLRFKHAPREYPGRYSIYTPIFYSGSGGSRRSPDSDPGTACPEAGSGGSQRGSVGEGTSSLSAGSGGSTLFAGHQHMRQPGEPSWLWRYDERGIATDSAAIASGGSNAFVVEEQKGEREREREREGEQEKEREWKWERERERERERRQYGNRLQIAVITKDGSIDLYNEQLEPVRTIGPAGYGHHVTHLDLDGDGEREIIIPQNNEGRVTVFRPGLKRPAELGQRISPGHFSFRGIAADSDGTPLLAVVSGDQQYMLKYKRNRLYLLGYAVYPGVYAGLMLFALLVQRTQRRKMQQRQLTEKQIAGLQLNLIRNQLDPHFTMNVLNSIIYSVKTKDADTAEENLMRFSRLYRNMLVTAGDIRRSLDEELAFCGDYLALERMRFGGKFDYSIDVSGEVDGRVLVPKMGVQVFAENAVKHGIAHLKQGGMIRIGAAMEGDALVLTVRDNGVGREAAGRFGSPSTGKGLQLTEDFFEVYQKYYQQEIVWEVRDLGDGELQDSEDAVSPGTGDEEGGDEVRGARCGVRDPGEETGNNRTGTFVEIRILNPEGGDD